MLSRFRRPVTIALAVTLAVAAPLTLSGCSLVNGVVSNATGGDVALPGTSVPDDFPAEVPLIDGEVAVGMALGDDTQKVWNVSIRVSGAEAYDTIAGQLTDAGFTQQDLGTNDDGRSGAFTSDALNVVVVVASDSDGFIANYTVSQEQ